MCGLGVALVDAVLPTGFIVLAVFKMYVSDNVFESVWKSVQILESLLCQQEIRKMVHNQHQGHKPELTVTN